MAKEYVEKRVGGYYEIPGKSGQHHKISESLVLLLS
jgi:hypothetical protein